MNESINILQLITQASLAVQIIMGVLLILSILGWVLIFHLGAKLSNAKQFDDRFTKWLYNKPLVEQFQIVNQESHRTGLEQAFFEGYQQFQKSSIHQLNLTERTLTASIDHEQTKLEQGLATLANIASVSPYIGLLGTVWGIMHAFIGLGSAHSVSLATIAPSIAEALIATALGLFAAIPASLAYNFLTAKAQHIYENRRIFCEKLLTNLHNQHTGSTQ